MSEWYHIEDIFFFFFIPEKLSFFAGYEACGHNKETLQSNPGPQKVSILFYEEGISSEIVPHTL